MEEKEERRSNIKRDKATNTILGVEEVRVCVCVCRRYEVKDEGRDVRSERNERKNAFKGGRKERRNQRRGQYTRNTKRERAHQNV